MYILKPVIHETIWGGRRLSRYTVTSCQKIGHLYLVNGHNDMSNEILNGDLKGRLLREAFPFCKSKWKLESYEEFPLTIALVDASDDLSIQVHPDDKMAQVLEGKSIGKKESWLFLKAPDNGWIYGGCKCNTIEEVMKAIDEGIMEDITEHVAIKRNDFVTVSAGTLHSVTRGSLVYEIEYGSNYTYRFFDFNRKDPCGRPRELHIEKAVKAIKPKKVPEVSSLESGKWIGNEFYEVCELTDRTTYRNCGNGIECVSVIEGEGKYDGIPISGGMSLLLFPGEEIKSVYFKRGIIARLVNNGKN